MSLLLLFNGPNGRATFPGPAALIVAGLAPRVAKGALANVGALTLAGLAPIKATAALPGVGALTLAGLAPRIAKTTLPGVGALALSGQAPRVARATLPGAGLLILSGQAPVIVKLVGAGLGQLSLAGFAPTINTISGPKRVFPGLGFDLTIGGPAPTIVILSPVMTRGLTAVRSGDAVMPGLNVKDPRWGNSGGPAR